MLEPKDLRGESRARLIERLGELKKEQFNLRFQRATGQLAGTARVREVRRDIARVNTVLREMAQPQAAG
jgi:large subunit ribosomal protein L29